jgi:23S rRNA pseudouridine1911/1915/1917 synthase
MQEEEFELEQDNEQDELFEHFRLEVTKGQVLIRIDKFLVNRIENVTRTKIQNAADAGNILVNGKPVKSNYRIKPLDVITIVMAHPPREKELIPENIPINIVYEDDEVVLVNKEPGMVVHPGFGNYSGTLLNALLFHFKNLPPHQGKKSEHDELRPGLVHRIDKNTSGIVILAKSEYSLAHLAKQFFDKTTKRTYVALVWGDVKNDTGTITGHVGRDLKDRKRMAVFPDGSHGKHAITHYKVLERFGYVTLVECKLETGRTHQIRVHFKHIGHPLFNDDTYGGDKILKGTTFAKYKQFIENCFEILPRHALHAKSLGFVHPVTKKEMFFDSELPNDMLQVIEKWRKYSQSKELEA